MNRAYLIPASKMVRFLANAAMLFTALGGVFGCQQSAMGGSAPSISETPDGCSPKEFSRISIIYAEKIQVAAPRDIVSTFLESFASELSERHSRNVACSYEVTVYDAFIGRSYPQKAKKTLSAEVSRETVCVNYFDDYPAPEDFSLWDQYPWKWARDSSYDTTQQRVFDFMCFPR